MKFRKFADLDWNVSEIGLGCWAIGADWGNVSLDDAREVLITSLDQGVNFYDTADVYGDGRSEQLVSELIKSTSERLYVATKAGRRLNPHTADGYNLLNIEKFVDRSLKNLGVECIDLLQLHCPPTETYSKKETYDMLDEIVAKGKIANYGVSVETVSQAQEALKHPNIKSVQIIFNIFRQKPSEVFFKEAKEKNVAVIVRVPLASGMLTGKMNKDWVFPENDHRNYNIKGEAFDIGETFSGVNFEKGLEAVERLKNLLPEGFSLTDLALKWILMHKEVTVVIPGAKNKQQVRNNLMASDKDDISEIISKINLVYDQLIRSDVQDRW
jgi:aryl-alcohol dehydrogenase-like predicted oxidoreductase